MSFEATYSNNIKRIKEALIKLRKDRAKYTGDLSYASQKIIRATQQLKNTKSPSTIKMRLNEIDREEKKKSDIEKKISELDSKIAKKEKELADEEAKLLKEQEKTAKKRELELKKSYSQLQSAIDSQKTDTQNLYEEIKKMKEPKEKINILFLGANPDIILKDGSELSKLKLDKEAREIKEAIVKSLNIKI